MPQDHTAIPAVPKNSFLQEEPSTSPDIIIPNDAASESATLRAALAMAHELGQLLSLDECYQKQVTKHSAAARHGHCAAVVPDVCSNGCAQEDTPNGLLCTAASRNKISIGKSCRGHCGMTACKPAHALAPKSSKCFTPVTYTSNVKFGGLGP